jgi:hypothetical protein
MMRDFTAGKSDIRDLCSRALCGALNKLAGLRKIVGELSSGQSGGATQKSISGARLLSSCKSWRAINNVSACKAQPPAPRGGLSGAHA